MAQKSNSYSTIKGNIRSEDLLKVLILFDKPIPDMHVKIDSTKSDLREMKLEKSGKLKKHSADYLKYKTIKVKSANKEFIEKARKELEPYLV